MSFTVRYEKINRNYHDLKPLTDEEVKLRKSILYPRSNTLFTPNIIPTPHEHDLMTGDPTLDIIAPETLKELTDK